MMKRLDVYLLRAFLQMFAGTFFVCLFVFMMQFTWRYTDELIGKGLGGEVLVKFFWYMALTLVPMSLPLAVLLASLITFGNLGENLELLSMKASGIPLLRILAPLVVCVLVVCGASFHFQNRIAPDATKKLSALVWSMKRKSPELEIPEGQFYGAIPGYNIFVDRKDKETGLLYDMMIYTNTGSLDEVQIVLADSARLQSTADKKHLQLTLYNGERFRNMDAQSGNRMRVSVPYMRETFKQEVDLIPFDTDFDLMNSDLFAHNAAAKDLPSISMGIDSLNRRIDSTAHALYAANLKGALRRADGQTGRRANEPSDSLVCSSARLPVCYNNIDSVYAGLTVDRKKAVLRSVRGSVRQLKADYDFRALGNDEDNTMLSRHHVEWHKKFTVALSCMAFFFIGAPLGAIIRKGGLGVPVIVSVLIFIFYYIINVSGEKMAKSGQWTPLFGVWLSSMVLAPVGVWLTIKSNDDSAVLNVDGYKLFFQDIYKRAKTWKLNSTL